MPIEIISDSDLIPPLRPNRMNVYSPADIKRWGVQRFLDTVCAKERCKFPTWASPRKKIG